MSHIVFLSSYFFNKPSANGICAVNLVNELRSNNHSVDVICYGPQGKETDEKVFFVKEKKLNEKSFFRKILLLINPAKANLDNNLICNYVNTIETINSRHKIDAVVGMFFPLESAEALRRIKRKFPQIMVLLYELDSIGDGVNKPSNWLSHNSYKRWLTRCYMAIDSIIIMKSHNDYWKKVFGHLFFEKSIVSDLPLLLKRNISTDFCKKNQMIYTGSLDLKYRSPIDALKILVEAYKSVDFKIAFYSKGNCEGVLNDYSKHHKWITVNGYISNNLLTQKIEEAEYLVSVGNSYSNSVPSKLIDYISYKKSIIHFTSCDNDVCVDYLSHYHKALIVDVRDNLYKNSEKLSNFLLESKSATLKEFDLDFFYKNTPEYNANLITKALKNGQPK